MPRRLDNLNDLFEHELKDIYDAENRLKEALRVQANESTAPEIKAAFLAHQKETESQIRRLERVFEAFGKEPNRGQGCAGIQGLLEEHKEFKAADPSREILDVFNLSAAQKVERYEITAYSGLIDLAIHLGLDEAVEPLEQNLAEEEATLEKVIELAETVDVYSKVSPAAKSA